LGLSAGALALGFPALAPVWSPSRSLLGISDRLTDESRVALTFDDGPHPIATPQVLDVLSEHGMKATFFLVGEQVTLRPSLAAEISARGHQIGLHSYGHRVVTWLTPRALQEDLDRAAYAIACAIGKVPDLYRPPRGIFTYAALAAVRRRGWHPVLWAADGRDWRRTATPAGIRQRIASRLRGGEVILLHDSDFYSSPGSWRNTVGALRLIVDELEARSLQAVPLTAGCIKGARLLRLLRLLTEDPR
jgi:peptidoglycan/xylan/chitin deacetylase (PgdA/CDA1 family)